MVSDPSLTTAMAVRVSDENDVNDPSSKPTITLRDTIVATLNGSSEAPSPTLVILLLDGDTVTLTASGMSSITTP